MLHLFNITVCVQPNLSFSLVNCSNNKLRKSFDSSLLLSNIKQPNGENGDC